MPQADDVLASAKRISAHLDEALSIAAHARDESESDPDGSAGFSKIAVERLIYIRSALRQELSKVNPDQIALTSLVELARKVYSKAQLHGAVLARSDDAILGSLLASPSEADADRDIYRGSYPGVRTQPVRGSRRGGLPAPTASPTHLGEPSLSPNVARMLADPSPFVRAASLSGTTDVRIYRQLATDESPIVRKAVARKCTDLDVVIPLLSDTDGEVRAASRSRFSEEEMLSWLSTCEDQRFRLEVAQTTSETKLLLVLAADEDWRVRFAALGRLEDEDLFRRMFRLARLRPEEAEDLIARFSDSQNDEVPLSDSLAAVSVVRSATDLSEFSGPSDVQMQWAISEQHESLRSSLESGADTAAQHVAPL